MHNTQLLDNNFSQALASYIDYLNNLRLSDLGKNLGIILTKESQSLHKVNQRELEALRKIKWSEERINDLISSNRGGEKGVHGFIAEFAEAGIANSKRALSGLKDSTKVLNDNGAADLLINNKEAQMKMYANMLDELKSSSKYRNMDMMFSKDHVDVYNKIMNGEKNIYFKGSLLSDSKIKSIKKVITDESKVRNESFDKWLKPSHLRYDEIQKGTIEETLSQEKNTVREVSNDKKSSIKESSNHDKQHARQQALPSMDEAHKIARSGAAIQGGINLGIFIYQKHKDGKNIWEYDLDDWSEGGLTFGKGAAKGAISGYGIYALTNVCGLAAPSAGALVSGTYGLINATILLRMGSIDEDEFLSLITTNALDATGAALGAAIGQVLIPIPVLGPLVGSIVTTSILELGKKYFNDKERKIIAKYEESLNTYIDDLDMQSRDILESLLEKYESIGSLQKYAFDIKINTELRLASSADLALLVGVPEEKILHNISDIDNFFIS